MEGIFPSYIFLSANRKQEYVWTGKYDSVIRGDDFRSLPLSDRRTSGASSVAQSIVSMTPQAIRGPPDPPDTPVVP